MIKIKYRAINMYETVVWEGEAQNAYWAWQKMFIELEYPYSEMVIHLSTDNGIRMEESK